jgi:hypothetical protein
VIYISRDPEPLSGLDAVQIAERVLRRPFRVQKIPVPVLRVFRVLVGPFNAVLASELGMGIGMQHGERTELGLRLSELGVQPTTFAAYVRRTLAAAAAP